MTQETYNEDRKQVFVSYHFTTMDAKFNGFGNYVMERISDSSHQEDTY